MPDRTITDAELDALIDTAIAMLNRDFIAIYRMFRTAGFSHETATSMTAKLAADVMERSK